MGGPGQDWLGDPSSAGRILLTAHLSSTAPPAPLLHAALDDLRRRHGWSASATVEEAPDPATALAGRPLLAARVDPAPVLVVRTDHALVLAAQHAHVDGLGLLALLGALTGSSLTSNARGLGTRPSARSALATGVGRAGELLRPPTHLTSPRHPAAGRDEWLRATTLPRTVGTAALVHATASALARMPGRRGGAVQVAVGASRRPGAPLGPDEVRDASTWLRVRDPQHRTVPEVGALLREAAPQPAAGSSAGPGQGLVAAVVRRLAGRLGSSVLVSHLGTVATTPVAGVRRLEFHPLAGGRSRLALGAVTVAGRTTLGLRGDAACTPPDMLDELLDRVVEELVEKTS